MQDALLPQDLDACHALIAELRSRVGAKDSLIVEQATTIVDLQASRTTLAVENDELNFTIQKLLARIYGFRRERFEDPAQQKFDFANDPAVRDGLADAAAEAEKVVEEFVRRRKGQKKKAPRNEQFPEHFERYEVTTEAPEADRICENHGPRKLIGFDLTETLEFERPKIRVRVTKYPKYACETSPGCGVKQAPRPEKTLVEGDRYAPSVAAEIIVGKCGFHLPIYRQQDWFAGSGWTPSRSTLLNIQESAAYVLEPLYDYYADWVRTAPVIPTDETNVMLLLPPEIPAVEAGNPRSQRIHEVLSEARAKGKSHVSARMWVYRSLGPQGANVFDFTVSRHRDGPQDFLKNFRGTLLGDCYSGFESIVLASDNRMTRAACNAHARRYWHEARTNHPREATQLLALYRLVYELEDQVRGQSPERVLEVRQQQIAPVMQEIRAWLDNSVEARDALPKSRLGEAVRYLKNNWDELLVFLGDPQVPIDNNETEQLMKQVATGRKNWLFIGSVEAGRRMAMLLTIVSTAHRYNLDLWAYLTDILQRLLDGDRDFVSMRADQWAQTHPQAIREYRRQEARYRADMKVVRRAKRRVARNAQK